MKHVNGPDDDRELEDTSIDEDGYDFDDFFDDIDDPWADLFYDLWSQEL